MRPPGNAGAVLRGEYVFDQSKETRAKAVVDSLRPVEPSLGDLTTEEQRLARDHVCYLNRIYEKRAASKPGNNAVYMRGK